MRTLAFSDPDEPGYEPISYYRPGGLCPISLGLSIGPGSPPRYHIVAKIGRGSFSTVWLAHDYDASRNVALKILAAEALATSKEVEMLERLKASGGPEQHVVELLDAFDHPSANGLHRVLVMEPVLKFDLRLSSDYSPMVGREAIRQMIAGVAFIHGRGVVHGDLHPANFGLAAPELNRFSDLDLWRRMMVPEAFPMVPTSRIWDSDAFPPYFCNCSDLGALLVRCVPEFVQRPLSVRVLDLGNAFLVDESLPPKASTPIPYAAPEIVFSWNVLDIKDVVSDQCSDIWSLALSIYNLVSSNDLFALFGRPHGDILYKMMCYCGEVPDAWCERFTEDPFPPGVSGAAHADDLWNDVEQTFAERGVEDPAALVRLLRRMMVFDPSRRPTAAELLRDPYFLQTKPSHDGHESGELPDACAAASNVISLPISF
ncbi:kinase-like domain-containing protein [Mycena olivaceomarginata]|nr:kinase-like domain-containing protein [Mycena olivaceomarginata]